VRFNLSPEKPSKAKAIPKTFPSKIPQSPMMIGQNKAVRVPQSPLPSKQQQQLNLTPKSNKLPLSTKIGSSLAIQLQVIGPLFNSSYLLINNPMKTTTTATTTIIIVMTVWIYQIQIKKMLIIVLPI